jgi:hypothetical protein
LINIFNLLFADLVCVSVNTVCPAVAENSSAISRTNEKSVPLTAAVTALVPFPFTIPVMVPTPVPPLATVNMPVNLAALTHQ